jgi:predicted PurR-regulated permease PerM
MPRIASTIALLGILLLVAVFAFQVMAYFLVPMFLALVLAIVFWPLYQQICQRSRGYDRAAAGVTTVVILLIFLTPAALVLLRAAVEAIGWHSTQDLPNVDLKEIAQVVAREGNRVGFDLADHVVLDKIQQTLNNVLTPLAIATPGFLVRIVVGLFVMIVSLYYFLADGPSMIRTVMRLSPLESKYGEQLIEQFGNLSRTMVLAMLVSAVAQGILAGIGFYFAGIGSVFLLTVLTMLLAPVPFLGAASVWVTVSVWLFFVKDSPAAAVGLAIYGALVVSTVDNLIKAVILHGRERLHPLLALLSVLGGFTALGPIGIFVGPMVIVFFYSLLQMLRSELDTIGREPQKRGLFRF